MEEKMMEENGKLAQLVNQAACCITMLNPTNVSDAEELQEVLRRIGAVAGDLDRDGADWAGRLKGTSAEAVEALQQLLQKDVEDTSKALDVVSQAIYALQDLTRQLLDPDAPAEAAEAGAAADTQNEEPARPQATIIPAEDAPLVLDFITEAGEHLETAESTLLELESQPDDTELINKVFRSFHTIKGMAGFLNLTEIGSLAHSSENLLDLARKGQLVLAGDATDVVFESIDALKKMLAGLQDSVQAGAPVAALEGLAVLLEKIEAVAEGKARPQPSQPALDPDDDKKLDAVLADKSAGETSKTSGGSAAHASEEKIKVSTARLDNLINMTGELVIAQLMVSEEVTNGLVSEQELARKVAHQGKIVRELQELSMSMRMVPVQGVFQKMARLARDVSRKAGKQVDFVTIGEETELDRTVVDKIADPLIHMVRNSVDHGIEASTDRVAAGKPSTGRVELRAFHQAGNIVIEIEDDGKGLDRDRILKKAVENGVVDEGQDLSDEDVFKLIFHPGLSTAEKVTSVSGRGVGMDVVKKNIEALRGKIDISSTPGKGTTFTIRLPLTLAVIDGQVVRIGAERYIIPINSIVRTLRPTRGQISSVQGRGEIILERGELIPLVRLYKLFGTVPVKEDATEALVVVVEEDGRKCCLLVDDLLAQQQVVIKSLGEALGRVRGVSGGAIMGDGRVTLILDVPGLVQLAQEQ